jgi:hypothetical protein
MPAVPEAAMPKSTWSYAARVEQHLHSSPELLLRMKLMADVFVEPVPEGGFQIEFAGGKSAPRGPFPNQEEAIKAAKADGHKPLVARVRNLTDKDKPDHWRAA